MSEKIVAFIPARGGSKSIPLKNIRHIAGRPLIYWVLDAACQCREVEEVYVSTECLDIAQCVGKYRGACWDKIKVIDRTAESATDTAPSEIALLEFCNRFQFDHVVFLQTTSPLTQAMDLDRAIEKYLASGCHSLLSVVKQQRFIWSHSDRNNFFRPDNYSPFVRPRRQEITTGPKYIETGAFYISGRNEILEFKCRLSGAVEIYEMPQATYFELDEPEDWVIVEKLLG